MIDWIPPAAKQHTVKVAPCLGCGKLPHPGTEQCLRAALLLARARIALIDAYVQDSNGTLPLNEVESRRRDDRLRELIAQRKR